MTWSVVFFFNSILLGVGLAMDAFSVSVANGLAEPRMRSVKRWIIAGTFAFPSAAASGTSIIMRTASFGSG